VHFQCLREFISRVHDKLMQDLIFTLCVWHALTKLWLHTSTTLEHLQATTRELGKVLRWFEKVTHTDFETADLPHEQATQAQRQAAKDSVKDNRNSLRKKVPSSTHRFFNLLTYKPHPLGDYFWAILMYGSTDNYSTQVVCILIYFIQFTNFT